MRIGGTELRYGVMLAPMAGYTDRAMRLICREAGAEYTVTEMVSAKAVVYNDKKTFSLARILADEGPVAVQIFGSEPEVMAEAARVLSEPCPIGSAQDEELVRTCAEYLKEGESVPISPVSPVAIDINMGCPVKKIFSNGEGSALMKSPRLIEKITSAVKGATPLPVTVKLRAGIDGEHLNAIDCAKAAEAGGASLICIHGRTTKQMYGGTADRKIIEKVKNSLQIPLIANGDIVDGASAVSMLKDTGADGIAIGRGAVGNPFIFSEIEAALEGKEHTPPTLGQRIHTALRQLSIAVIEKGEAVATAEARKQIALYIRSFRGASQIRAKINLATTFSEVREALEQQLNIL